MALAAAGTAKMAAKAARREKPSADICGEETRCGAATGEKLATGEKADADAAKVARTMRAVIEISSRSQRFRANGWCVKKRATVKSSQKVKQQASRNIGWLLFM